MTSYSPIWTPSTNILSTVSVSGNPSVTPILLTPQQLVGSLDNGDLQMAIRMVPAVSLVGMGTSVCFFHATSANGETSLTFVPGFDSGSVYNATGTYTYMVEGVVIYSGSTSPIGMGAANVLAWAPGQEISVEPRWMPWLASQSDALGAADTAGVTIDVMGCTIRGLYNYGGPTVNYAWSQATGSGLAPFTAMAIGSRLDGTLAINAAVDQVTFSRTGNWYRKLNAKILILGDSNETSWLLQPPCISLARSAPAYRSKPPIVLLARSGSEDFQMQASINADWYFRDLNLACILVTGGINEIINSTTFANTISARTTLLAFIRQYFAGVKIVQVLPSPASGGLQNDTQRGIYNQVVGSSGYSTLDSDAVVSSHLATLGDGASPYPGLQAQYQAYDISPPLAVKDGLHIDGTSVPIASSGRGIKGAAEAAALTSLGFGSYV